ncbi:uncharacterized protein F4807DRAFT_457283 [Annulohypoxylon truncatum]|uniref:uncharacterized protein n=1 Tax=Annulohypoxylon truncatum TaxID=327061 RepID=UPI002007EB8B|nr:uncharacterized protein F4807DRAFT_457283 [Annulohypoxylon truncatum]KAI1213195.1 hypothetical protein F4807DRAFT_457283 [Annulohypoxylon truncatum]
MELRSGRLTKSAKAIATDRRKRKEKHRQVRRWVLEKHKANPESDDDRSDVDGSDAESSLESTTVRQNSRKVSVWKQKAFSGGQPGPRGVTLRGMLSVASRVYSLAALELDKMSLYDHISYILSAIKDPETPLPKTIVSREVVVMAQHQEHFAREDLGARLALRAVISNLELLDLSDSVKTCQNCFEKFRQPTTHYHPDNIGNRFLGPCQYHPGQLRSWNDQLDQDDKTRQLGGGFLSEGRVKLEEFKLWISTCYWDCCDGKLLEVDPEAAKRSQRRKKDPPKPWEIPNENDGKVGCTALPRHIPF